MHKLLLLIGILHFHFLSSSAQKDSVAFPSVKIFVNGSMNRLCGWKPEQGKFYSSGRYDDTKVKTNSWGYGCGLNISKRVARIFYISAGIMMSVKKYDKFRTTPYPASTLLNDTAYYGYKLKTLDIPLIFQLPLYFRKNHVFLCAGTVTEFTYSESFYTTYTEYTNGYGYRFNKEFNSNVTRYSGTRLSASCDFEFKNTEGPIQFLLGLGYLSPAMLLKDNGSYFLEQGSSFFFRMGFGYSFVKKKQEQIEFI